MEFTEKKIAMLCLTGISIAAMLLGHNSAVVGTIAGFIGGLLVGKKE